MTNQQTADALGISVYTLRRWKERPEYPDNGTIEEKIAYAIANRSTKGQKRGAATIKPPPNTQKGKNNGKAKTKEEKEIQKQLSDRIARDAELSAQKKRMEIEKLKTVTEKGRQEIIDKARIEIMKEVKTFLAGLRAALKPDKKYTGREVINIINKLRGE